jgi:glycosyltransferase involved in cell wall biosynthesis
MISPQFRPSVGGYERAAERLSTALAARGGSVTVITERRQCSWPAHEVVDGVVVRRLPCLYRPHLHMLSSLLAFAWFLLRRGRGFGAWHVHQYGLHAVLAVAMGKLLGRPVVLKLTSSAGKGIRNAVARLPLSPRVAALLRRVDACVAISQETGEEALAFGIPADRIERLANGVDAHRFHPVSSADRLAARADLGLVATGLIVFVGRLSPEKNPDGLLAAWQAAQPRLPSGWKLVLVGDGPMRGALTARIEADGLGESVRLVGERSDVERWLRAADIYVLASHREGLSNTTLEAMASGLPVVSTRVSGSAETVGETGAGLVVDIGRMDEVAGALVRLATDAPLRERMGRNGRAVVEEKYSSDRVAEAYLALYRRLISAPAAHKRNA